MTRERSRPAAHVFRPPSDSAVLPETTPDPNRMLLPGWKGVPVRNFSDKDLKGATPEVLDRLPVTWDIHFRIFNMADDDDRKAYETLESAAASMHAHVQIFREIIPDNFGDGNWKIAVKWGEKYLEPNPYKGVRISDGNPLGV